MTSKFKPPLEGFTSISGATSNICVPQVHTMLKTNRFYDDVCDAMQSSVFQKIIAPLHKEKKMQQILNEVTIIIPNINLWAGDKSLKPEDLAANGIDVSKLPPGKLAHLGSKKTINKDDLKEFVALKREAHASCARVGVKFGDSGYAIPDACVDDLCVALADIKVRFMDAKAAFLSDYDTKINEWIESNEPEWREVIRKCVDPVGRVEDVMSFNFSAFKINPVGCINGLDEEVGGLHGQLCKEVRTIAKNAIASSFVSRLAIGRRALRPAIAILTKLEGLIFLDITIQPIADELKVVIQNVENEISNSPEKECSGKELNVLIGVMTKLSNMGLKVVYETEPETEEELPTEEVAAAIPVTINKVTWDF